MLCCVSAAICKTAVTSGLRSPKLKKTKEAAALYGDFFFFLHIFCSVYSLKYSEGNGSRKAQREVGRNDSHPECSRGKPSVLWEQLTSKVITERAFMKFQLLFQEIIISVCKRLPYRQARVHEQEQGQNERSWSVTGAVPCSNTVTASEFLSNINLEQVHLTGNGAANK